MLSAPSLLSWTEVERLVSWARALSMDSSPTETPPISIYVEQFLSWLRTTRPERLLSGLSGFLPLNPLRYLIGFPLPWPSTARETEAMREIEMVCGECSSYLSLTHDQPCTSIMSLALRFANAHVKCGYVSSGTSDEVLEKMSLDEESLENQ